MKGTAIVIGAGIGGLATALGLRRAGWTVTVLERDDEVREVGAGLSLSPNALRALDALGVGERARSVSMPTLATSNLRTPSGGWLQRARPGDGDPPLRAFRRGTLHRLLRDAVPSEWLHTGVEVTGVDSSGGKATVVHTGGELTGDLVVAADGIHSTTRRLLMPAAAPPRFLRYAGWVGLAGTDELAAADDGLAGSVTMGRGRYFLIHPVGPGQVYWVLGMRADQPGVRFADELGEARRVVGGWHDPIPAVVDATAPGAVRHLDIYELPPLATYVTGNVALLGDAAHAMSPDRGQGAGTSLEDAVVLAAALAAAGGVPAALARYDRERRERTQSIARNSRRTGQQTLATNPAVRLLTRLMLRLVPASLWRRATAPGSNPIWRWAPPALPG